jgi:hypothetical protein
LIPQARKQAGATATALRPAARHSTLFRQLGALRMIDNIARLVNADANLVRRGRFVDTIFMIAIDDAYTLIRVQEGRITKVTLGPFITPNYSFCLRASRDVWEKFWQPLPPLGFTDVFALVKQKLMRVEGDVHPFMANLLYFKEVIAAPRKEAVSEEAVR